MGKSYLLEWFERNIENCEVISFNLSDNASMQFVLLHLADAMQAAGVITTNFEYSTKPRYVPSRAEASNIVFEQSPNASVHVNVEHAQNSDEMLVVYTERLRALARDVKLTLQRHDLPRFVVMFDQMERYDHATNSFIYRVLAPTMYALPCFQFVFAGNGVTRSIPTVPSRAMQKDSLQVTLTPFTNAHDIAEYLRINGGQRVSGRNLSELSEEILSEFQGMPSLVGKFVRIFCGGARE